MSVMVFLIAFVPAILVVLIAAFTQSRGIAVVAAIIAAAIGIGTGSPVFMVIDLLFVAAAMPMVWQVTAMTAQRKQELREEKEAQERERQAQIAAERAQAAKPQSWDELHVIWLLAAGGILWIWKPWSPESPKSSAQPEVVTAAPSVATPAPPQAVPVTQNARAKPSKPASQRPPNKQKKEVPRQTQPQKQMVDCLLMQSEKEMVRCLESAQ